MVGGGGLLLAKPEGFDVVSDIRIRIGRKDCESVVCNHGMDVATALMGVCSGDQLAVFIGDFNPSKTDFVGGAFDGV